MADFRRVFIARDAESRRVAKQASARLCGALILLSISTFGFVGAGESDESVVVLVDDFQAQPAPGEPFHFFNRLGGDRGLIGGSGGSLHWGEGFVTASISGTPQTQIGSWTSLNHTLSERIPLDFSAIFPRFLPTEHQGRVTGLQAIVLDGKGTLRFEVQAPDGSFPWQRDIVLEGGPQDVELPLPSLHRIQSLNWLLIGSSGDFVTLDRLELIVQVPHLEPSRRAFLWNYGMLLNNWNTSSGLTRDRANFPDGDFDNIAASGLQAAAAVLAAHQGFIPYSTAVEIVEAVTTALLDLPDCKGLLPHFVTDRAITPGTEWSSIDTVIAWLSVLLSREALGLETGAVERALAAIRWSDLLLPNGSLSHGYRTNCVDRLESGWSDFGTESWLTNLGYAAATGKLAAMNHAPPTFNGSGFITELAWLLVPAPRRDRWGTSWKTYREAGAETQIAYYQGPNHHPCFGPQTLFGLSAAEVPQPWQVLPEQVYQPFGVGGITGPNDGTGLLGHAVVTPHYAALVASIRPFEALRLWNWLGLAGLFTPLNNAESLMFTDEPDCQELAWNSLKGSLNLAFQTLGWGGFLAGPDHPLHDALRRNRKLRQGYELMTREAWRLPRR